MRVGFIGLGNMGRHMAMHVLEGGHELTVYDVREEAAEAHLERGAAWADSPEAVAAASDLVLTSLPGPHEVEQVALGEAGILAGITPGSVYVDLSTNSYVLQVWDKTANAWVNDGAPMRTSNGVSFGFGTLGTPPPNTQVNIAMSPPCTNGLTAGGVIANSSCVTFNSRGLPINAAGVLYARHALYLRSTIGVFATTVTSTPLIRFWSSPNGNASWIPR